MTDKSDEICERIIETGFHADMLENLTWHTLSVESLNESESHRKRYFVRMLITILYNVVRRAKTARSAFRQHQAVDVVHKFRSVVVDSDLVISFYFLTYSVNTKLRQI